MLLLRLHAHQRLCTRLGVRGRRRRCRPREELLHRGLTGTERWRLRSLLGPRRLRGSRHHHLEQAGGGSTLRRGGIPRTAQQRGKRDFKGVRCLPSQTLQVAASPSVGTRRVANASCGASEPAESSTPWAAALPNPRRLRIPQQRSSPYIGRWTSSRRLRPPRRSPQQRRSCSGRPRSRSRRQRSDAYRAYRILLYNRKRARGAMKCPTLAYCTTPRRRLPAI